MIKHVGAWLTTKERDAMTFRELDEWVMWEEKLTDVTGLQLLESVGERTERCIRYLLLDVRHLWSNTTNDFAKDALRLRLYVRLIEEDCASCWAGDAWPRTPGTAYGVLAMDSALELIYEMGVTLLHILFDDCDSIALAKDDDIGWESIADSTTARRWKHEAHTLCCGEELLLPEHEFPDWRINREMMIVASCFRDEVRRARNGQEVEESSPRPLTDSEQRVFDLIHELPSGKGITGKQIVSKLAEEGYPLDQGTLTRHIIPTLKQSRGVRNRSCVGYYTDLQVRASAL